MLRGGANEILRSIVAKDVLDPVAPLPHDDDLVASTVERLIVEHDPVASSATFDRELWDALDRGGFTRVGVPLAFGGSGGSVRQAHRVLELVGAHAAAVPVAETMVAGWLCAAAGLELPDGVVTVASPVGWDVVARHGSGWVVTGVAHRVPWARCAQHIVVAAPHLDGLAVATVPAGAVAVESAVNLAGEPRDTVRLTGVRLAADLAVVVEGACPDQAATWGAMVRSVTTAGAARRIVEMTRDHVTARVQFGTPLATQQVVKHMLADAAAEVAAATVAAEACMVLSDGHPGLVEAASAKIRTARAATRVAAVAHQLHGAIGFTDEHPLHRLTTRTWSWRDEPRSQSHWDERLGTVVTDGGASQLWPLVTGGRGTAAG